MFSKCGFRVLRLSHYKEGCNTLRRIGLVLTIAVVMVAMLMVTALPAAAQGFGPSVACDAGTFNGCTDSVFPGSSKESFTCEGKVGDTASCTNQRTSKTSPYCVFLGHEPSEDRDLYLCGPEPANH